MVNQSLEVASGTLLVCEFAPQNHEFKDTELPLLCCRRNDPPNNLSIFVG